MQSHAPLLLFLSVSYIATMKAVALTVFLLAVACSTAHAPSTINTTPILQGTPTQADRTACDAFSKLQGAIAGHLPAKDIPTLQLADAAIKADQPILKQAGERLKSALEADDGPAALSAVRTMEAPCIAIELRTPSGQ